ncbi:hypothetical protein [Tautonia marina]|uniref:hypothetical protein n=1 Tax=Tautonia marina TaxID=2653855 RepID=UPI001260A051|nr:hypothetical protein [Tautonia marina]
MFHVRHARTVAAADSGPRLRVLYCSMTCAMPCPSACTVTESSARTVTRTMSASALAPFGASLLLPLMGAVVVLCHRSRRSDHQRRNRDR